MIDSVFDFWGSLLSLLLPGLKTALLGCQGISGSLSQQREYVRVIRQSVGLKFGKRSVRKYRSETVIGAITQFPKARIPLMLALAKNQRLCKDPADFC